ncbi:OmpW family protein [Litoribrevibacter euphylliae]|uniref:OmpW family protein n=1 Tax=Litoribrevibacter euphylliae TaxID=1834034 RepID=A0ABV7H6M5_9GAMM
MKMNKLGAAILTATLAMSGATAVHAYDAGDIIVRAGAATVEPENAPNGDILVSASGADTGLNAVVDNDTQLGLNFVYMLSQNVGVEVLAATPFEHEVYVEGAGLKVGSTKHLPPTVSLQYFLLGDTDSKFQPYAGVGLNYTWFFDENANSSDGFSDLDLDDSMGFAAQIGVDYLVTDNILLNASVYKMDIDTDATVNLDGVGTLKSDVEIDPMVYMVSVGYKL